MGRRFIETSLTPEIFVQSVAGDMSLRGWDAPQISASGDPEGLEISGNGDQIQINTSDDLDLRLPSGARVHIDNVAGDASIKLLEEPLELGMVAGSLDLRNVAGVNAGDVHGNLSAKSVDGDLNLNSVHGNADVKNVQGHCNLFTVHGNLDLQNVSGNVQADAHGNARLRFDHLDGINCTVTAHGNVYCYLPEDASVQLHLVSEGDVIKVRLPDSSKTIQQSQYDLTLGEGEASFSLTADGVIYLFVEMGGWSQAGDAGGPGLPSDFGQQIARQVESQIQSQMEEVNRRLEEQMSRLTDQLNQSGLSPEETERIVQQTMRNSERETVRTQEKMRRAQEKLERKLESQRRKVEAKAQAADRRNRRSWGFEWPSPPSAPPPPPPPSFRRAPESGASEEERLMILRMLEQKKITLDEADRLLSALEGKD
jgi:hypothetical protein